MITKFLLLLMFSINAYPASVYTPTDIYPTELKTILASVQENALTTEEMTNLESYILLIDDLPKFFNKEEIFFYIKTETYKTILEEGITDVFNINNPNEKMLEQYKEIVTGKNGYSQFSRYIIDAIEKDLEVILDSPFYQSFLFKKVNTREIPESEVQRVTKNFTILYHWYEIVRDYDINEFNKLTAKLGFKILKRITNNSRLIPILSAKDFKANTDISKIRNFKVVEIKTKAPEPSAMDEFIESTGMEEFIDQNIVPEEIKPEEPEENEIKLKKEVKKEDWKPKETPSPTPEKMKVPKP